MRLDNPSAVLNFRNPSIDLDMERDVNLLDELSVLRFTPKVHRRVKKSSSFGKRSTVVRRANKKPEYLVLWFLLGSGERIRTTDLRVMSKHLESVLFVRRVLQIS